MKTIKLISKVVLFIVLFAILYFILIWREILPNPFLDISDLVCKKVYNESLEESITIKFDKKSLIKSIDFKLITKFNSEEAAKKYKEEMYGTDAIVENNSVITTKTQEIEDYPLLVGKLRKDAIKIIESETYYECEK